jgi:hypothetical protein
MRTCMQPPVNKGAAVCGILPSHTTAFLPSGQPSTDGPANLIATVPPLSRPSPPPQTGPGGAAGRAGARHRGGARGARCRRAHRRGAGARRGRAPGPGIAGRGGGAGLPLQGARCESPVQGGVAARLDAAMSPESVPHRLGHAPCPATPHTLSAATAPPPFPAARCRRPRRSLRSSQPSWSSSSAPTRRSARPRCARHDGGGGAPAVHRKCLGSRANGWARRSARAAPAWAGQSARARDRPSNPSRALSLPLRPRRSATQRSALRPTLRKTS